MHMRAGAKGAVEIHGGAGADDGVCARREDQPH